jgi:hypothetical protein
VQKFIFSFSFFKNASKYKNVVIFRILSSFPIVWYIFLLQLVKFYITTTPSNIHHLTPKILFNSILRSQGMKFFVTLVYSWIEQIVGYLSRVTFNCKLWTSFDRKMQKTKKIAGAKIHFLIQFSTNASKYKNVVIFRILSSFPIVWYIYCLILSEK